MQTHYVQDLDNIDPEVMANVIKIDDTFCGCYNP